PAVGIVARFADWIIGDHVIDEVFLAGVAQLMRFVRPEDEGVARHELSSAAFVTDASFAGNDQIKLPLRRMRVIRKSWFPRRNSIPFQIKWMTLRQIERSRFAPECFRNSFERHGVFPARRLPRLLFNLV